MTATIANSAMDHGQQAIWEYLRKIKRATLRDLWMGVDMEVRSVRSYVRRLEAGGYVAPVGVTEGQFDNRKAEHSVVYQLVKNTGRLAPRLTEEGQPVTQGAGQKNMWRTMRMLRTFTASELQAHASTSKVTIKISTVRDYTKFLYWAGYLQIQEKERPPVAQRTYRLNPKSNTGPKAPMVLKTKTVFDPNLDTMTYVPGEVTEYFEGVRHG